MMSKELLKKAGILGISFGLLASPMAFAQTTDHPSIEENQDSMVQQDGTQDHGVNMNTNEAPDYTEEELRTDHHTQGPNDETIGEPDSMGSAAENAKLTPEEVVERNSDS